MTDDTVEASESLVIEKLELPPGFECIHDKHKDFPPSFSIHHGFGYPKTLNLFCVGFYSNNVNVQIYWNKLYEIVKPSRRGFIRFEYCDPNFPDNLLRLIKLLIESWDIKWSDWSNAMILMFDGKQDCDVKLTI